MKFSFQKSTANKPIYMMLNANVLALSNGSNSIRFWNFSTEESSELLLAAGTILSL